jgi:hypothetical protein
MADILRITITDNTVVENILTLVLSSGTPGLPACKNMIILQIYVIIFKEIEYASQQATILIRP